jgi:hypothetical protein
LAWNFTPDEAGDDLLTRMIPIKSGASELSISLRSAVKLHFKLGSEDDGLDFCVTAHHGTPSLISKNYEGSKGNKPSRQFKILASIRGSILRLVDVGKY